MHFSPRRVAIISVLAVCTPSLASPIINPSFEDFDFYGTLRGWSGLDDNGQTPLPEVQSNQWAFWNGGPPPPQGAGDFAATTTFAGARQLISLNAGDVILFDVSPHTPGTHSVDHYFMRVWLTPANIPYPGYIPWYDDITTPTLWSRRWPFETPLLGH